MLENDNLPLSGLISDYMYTQRGCLEYRFEFIDGSGYILGFIAYQIVLLEVHEQAEAFTCFASCLLFLILDM